MSNRVVDVHSIAAAPAGWRRISDKKVVACFALVTTTSSDHPGQFNEKIVLPIIEGELLVDLLGREVDIVNDDACFEPLTGE